MMSMPGDLISVWPLPALSTFYRENGIEAVDDFRCRHRGECERAAAALMPPRELHNGAEAGVGTKYGSPFRIVVVSLSISNGIRRLEDAQHGENWATDPNSRLNRHMKGTLEILRAILEPDVSGREVFRHYALVNSAKCSLKGTAGKVPPKCFEECAEFLLPELSCLAPQLVISQGKEAAEYSLQKCAKDLDDSKINLVDQLAPSAHKLVKDMLCALVKEHFRILDATDIKALWLKLLHPSEYSGRWSLLTRLEIVPLLGWAARNLVEQHFPQTWS